MSTDYGNVATNLIMLGAGAGIAMKMLDSGKSRRPYRRVKRKKQKKLSKRMKA
jgi:hypothetical protein